MTIQPMTRQHASAVIHMMREFYASDAVFTNGSPAIFENDVAACVGDSPFAEGFVFIENDSVCGYAMLAHSFSTEFGKRCVWLEDLFLKESARGKGYATAFIEYLKTAYPDCVLRLEVEKENTRAVATYRKNGFSFLPYDEMICR